MITGDTSRDTQRVQMELYRRMSPARKFELICQAYEFGKSIAMAGIRMRFPDADEQQVRQLWAKQHLGEDLYARVFGSLRK